MKLQTGKKIASRKFDIGLSNNCIVLMILAGTEDKISNQSDVDVDVAE